MKIIVDISHPAHLNFLKVAIKKLIELKHDIVISYLDRGVLFDIINKEFHNVKKYKVGIHKGTKLSIIIQANLFKFWRLFWLIRKEKIDIGLSMGNFTLAAALKFNKKKSFLFDDDPERKISVFLSKIFCTEINFPPIIESKSGKVKTYNALKEWSYLSPRYFIPNIKILENYSLLPKKYIFVREVSNKTLNYLNQKSNIIAFFASHFPAEFKVVLSLEDKSTRNLYPDSWIILKEPVEDIHSLIYFSKLLISSGDSMSREGAILGVPSIYCGDREMKANNILIGKGLLFKVLPGDILQKIGELVGTIYYDEFQETFRNKLLAEWIDIPQLIIKKLTDK